MNEFKCSSFIKWIEKISKNVRKIYLILYNLYVWFFKAFENQQTLCQQKYIDNI